jgi:hypothetical protein
MDIKDLDKRQLILLTLLITFVVSIATGIITVSLMKQMPASVPQTINNVIQRTIEKVTTVEVPAKNSASKNSDATPVASNTQTQEPAPLGDGDVMVPIYPADISIPPVDSTQTSTDTTNTENPQELGQGIIISDVGLILVDTSILTGADKYTVVLNKTNFDATVLKKFSNGFSILKISPQQNTSGTSTDTTDTTIDTTGSSAPTN